MTVLTTASQILCLGDGTTTVFNYSFLIPGSSSTDQTNVQVTYTDTAGNVTVLNSAQFSITGVNNASGGTVTFTVNSAAILSGSTLLIQRVVPYTQPDSISNQGNFYPVAVEDAIDNIELQIQQIRSQDQAINWRGTWQISTVYHFGDLVVDGANGNNTQNVYFCIKDNVSTASFTNDVNAGDWTLAINFSAALATLLTGGTTGQILKKTSATNLDATWYSDIAEMKFGVVGVLSDSQVVGYWTITQNCTIPANFGAVTVPASCQSEATAVANATGSTVFNFDKRTASPNTWTTEGTITFGASGITPTFATTGSAAVALVKGDVVRIIGPATHDTTLSSPTFNIIATRP